MGFEAGGLLLTDADEDHAFVSTEVGALLLMRASFFCPRLKWIIGTACCWANASTSWTKRSSSGRNKAGEGMGAFSCWRQKVATWPGAWSIGT